MCSISGVREYYLDYVEVLCPSFSPDQAMTTLIRITHRVVLSLVNIHKAHSSPLQTISVRRVP